MVLESPNAWGDCWAVATGVAMVSEIRTAETIRWKKKLIRQRTKPRFLALLGMTRIMMLNARFGAALATTGISVPPEVAKSRFTEYKR
jgi:hypothetical protein